MGRTLSSDLQDILAAPTREIDWTLDVVFPAIDPLRLATSPLTLVKGEYSNDLENVSEIRQTLESATDQVNVQIQNKDQVFGLHVANNLNEWRKAEAVIGRVYRGAAKEEWIEMFRGAVQKPEVDDTAPYNIGFDVVTDTRSTGSIVCNRTLALACPFLFKHARTCGYSGAETFCDHNLKSKFGCEGKANTHHFGGMEHRYNPDLSVPGTGGNTDTGGGTGGPIGGGNCPRLDQFVLVKGKFGQPVARMVFFVKPSDLLFNPVTGTFHEISSLEIIENLEIFEMVAANGAACYSSCSHKVIRHRADDRGETVTKFTYADPVLTWIDGLNDSNIISALKTGLLGDVMRIEMKDGHIYAAGSTADKFIAAHNYKNPIDVY